MFFSNSLSDSNAAMGEDNWMRIFGGDKKTHKDDP